MPSANHGSVPFQEQLDFFRRKLNIPTASWTDIYTAEHDWAFMVAGANRDEIVADFRESIDRMIDEGLTLEDFRKDFDRIVAEHGWDYKGGRNWRSRVIYETNLFSSYSAGRYQQLLQSIDALPYWQYHHSDAVEHPRQQHLLWDGMILKATDPVWQWIFPINAWGCQCYVTALSEHDLKMLGKTGPDPSPQLEWEAREIGQRSPNGPRLVNVPKGIDPGFEYTPGRARLQSAVPPELDEPPQGSSGVPGLPNTRPQSDLPVPRVLDATRLLPDNLTDNAYAEAFLNEFGATLDEAVLYEDVIGERLAIGADLFRNRKTGTLKANKQGRGPYLPILAEAIRSPDEIWVRIEHQKARNTLVVRRRYLAQFQLPDRDVPALAVFEWGPQGWSGITVFNSDNHALDNMRIGVRLYRREEK